MRTRIRWWLWYLFITSTTGLISASPLLSQPVTKADLDTLLNKSKVVSFGLSFGPRFLTIKSENHVDLTLANLDTIPVLQKDILQRRSMVLSAAVLVRPWKYHKSILLRNLGFIANLDLAKLSESSLASTFNQELEGGIGVGWFFASDVGVAVTYDLSFTRRPRSRLLSMVGKPIKLDGEVLTSLDPNDDRLFKDAVADGIGIKIFFSF